MVNDTIKSKVANNQEIVFELIKSKEGLSAPKIAEHIEKSLRTTMRYLDALKKNNKIEFRGAPKTGGYYLKK
jgi:ATP-dependent DNA helicase RecG